ncbi:MAG: allophanate hydrolase [Dehalococcoidia bacterium]|nr:MAG: allophanate hydrolase [Dehalococcoidia bacterium]
MAPRWPRLQPFGEGALLVELAARPSVPTARRVAALAAALERLPGVQAVVPAAVSVLILGEGVSEAGLASALSQSQPLRWRGRRQRIPVRFGGLEGPDLAEVAALAGLTPEEVIRLLTSRVFTVVFLGFAPGFPYLLGLPRRLAVPRLATPRPRVPAGSVALAGGWLGIYPQETPGGWRLVGRTSHSLFDPSRTPPALLAPGDRVQLQAT